MSYDAKIVAFSRDADYLRQRALKNKRASNLLDALDLMRQAVEKAPDNVEYQLDLAHLYAEMGLFRQSNQLLSRILARPDAPDECLYGMAQNALSEGDIARAEKMFHLYLSRQPGGENSDEAYHILENIETAREGRVWGDRRMMRAIRVSDSACGVMQTGDFARAIRLFDRSLQICVYAPEIFSLRALAHFMNGDRESAARDAQRAADSAASAQNGGVKALCISSQVFGYMGDAEKSRALIERAIQCPCEGAEARLLANALCELGMHEEALIAIRRCLIESPYDCVLIHQAAIAMLNTGSPIQEAIKCWERILRLTPEDPIAAYYKQAAENGALPDSPIDYNYQIPATETKERLDYLGELLSGGLGGLDQAWQNNSRLRRVLEWGISLNHERFTRTALSVLAAVSDPEAGKLLSGYLTQPDAPFALRMHAAALMHIRGDMDQNAVGNSFTVNCQPTEDEAMAELSVGQKQMIRYAADYVREKSGRYAVVSIALIWGAFLANRQGVNAVRRSECGAAALAYVYLKYAGESPDIVRVAKWFRCPVRQVEHIVFKLTRVIDAGFRAIDAPANQSEE